jgi:hypothetical protein
MLEFYAEERYPLPRNSNARFCARDEFLNDRIDSRRVVELL